MTPTFFLAAAVAATFLVVLFLKPRLFLLPVVVFFAFWAWFKTLLAIPTKWHALQDAKILESRVAALRDLSQVAAVFWNLNTEFRPVALELFSRVAGDCGINTFAPPPMPKGHDPFAAQAVSAAADLVQTAGPAKKPASVSEIGQAKG